LLRTESEKGPWLQKEFAPVTHKKDKQWRSTGFKAADINAYERVANKKSAYVNQLPICPVCGTQGSSSKSKVCRKDGHVLYLRSWDIAKDCLFYVNVQTREQQYHSPFDPEVEARFLEKYKAEDDEELGGFTTRRPDKALAGLTAAREQDNAGLKSWA